MKCGRRIEALSGQRSMNPITPSPLVGIGVMGRRPGPGVNEADVPPNLPILAGARILALYGGEEVSLSSF